MRTRCASAPNANASTRPITTVEISGAWCVMSVSLERETIAQIAPVGNDLRHDATLRLARHQGVDLVELVHGDELKHFDAHAAVGAARQFVHHLEAFGRLRLADRLYEKVLYGVRVGPLAFD